MTRLRFAYRDALALTVEEAEQYLEAWDELNSPEKKTKRKVKPKKA